MLSTLLRRTLLAPGTVEAILDGRQAEGITLPGLMKGVEVECKAHLATVFTNDVAETTATQATNAGCATGIR